MIHLYFGDGKGKTTAAVGLAVRALGQGIPVVFVQFLKSRPVGEVKLLEKLGAIVLRGKATEGFASRMTEEEKIETKRISNHNFEKALSLCKKKSCVLLVLDEVCAAWNLGLVDRVEIEYLISNKTENMEIVLTGRNPPPVMIEKADYVTEMKKEKHPFDAGVSARRGIEF